MYILSHKTLPILCFTPLYTILGRGALLDIAGLLLYCSKSAVHDMFLKGVVPGCVQGNLEGLYCRTAPSSQSSAACLPATGQTSQGGAIYQMFGPVQEQTQTCVTCCPLFCHSTRRAYRWEGFRPILVVTGVQNKPFHYMTVKKPVTHDSHPIEVTDFGHYPEGHALRLVFTYNTIGAEHSLSEDAGPGMVSRQTARERYGIPPSSTIPERMVEPFIRVLAKGISWPACLQTTPPSQKGGALLQSSTNSNIQNSTFQGNAADQGGGAIFQTDVASSISFSVFQENSGGALYRNACRGYLINCSFINNTARQGGAVYLNNCQQNNIRNCEFTGNRALQGSALFLNNSIPVITGSLFNGSNNPGNTIFRNNVGTTASGGRRHS
eukprot:jgi/Botrbrau1/21771/Bobra.43_1s0161.1